MNTDKKKILIIDDEEIIGKIFSKYLQAQGFNTLIAENGKEGLDIYYKERPHLILTDLNMPQVNGLEVVKQIVEDSTEIPVIVVSGTDDIKDMVKAIRYGAWDYIIKPVEDLGVLMHLVSKALERARLLEENRRYKENLEEEVKIRTRAYEEELTMRIKSENLLQSSLEDLGKITDQIIFIISKISDIRDPFTGGHQHRVSQLAQIIAETMGLNEDTVKAIYTAGMLHDIGKISVPLDILSKPGKITDIERAMIKIHTETGYLILKEIDFPWPIHHIAYQHHERIDGSGYPRGLKGEEILPESKIISIADVVEAIASHRPYRPSRGIGPAIEEIVSKRGIYYDSVAVDACVEILKGGFTFK